MIIRFSAIYTDRSRNTNPQSSRNLGLRANSIEATHDIQHVLSAIQRRDRTGKDLLDAGLERDGLEVRVQLPCIQIAQVLGVLHGIVGADVLGVDVFQAPDGEAFLPVVRALLVVLDGGVQALDYFVPRDLSW